MSSPRHFPAAPWPTALKISSTLGAAVLAGAGYGAYRAIPIPTGFTHAFGLGVALVFPLIGAFALLFTVRGYVLDGRDLYVQRLVTSTRIPLDGLTQVWHMPSACRGSIRVLGNGGLFSFTGIYRSRALGRYRLFATDFARAVVLALPARVVVISPEQPLEFVEHVRRVFPDARGGPAG